jgi:hypothetical protein
MTIIVTGIPNFVIGKNSETKNLVTAPNAPPKKTAITEDSIQPLITKTFIIQHKLFIKSIKV